MDTLSDFPTPSRCADTALNHLARARAYDRRNANQRAVFALAHWLEPLSAERWRIVRRWTGVGDELLTEETVHWCARQGLLKTLAHSPSMGERLEAVRRTDGDASRIRLDTLRVAAAGTEPVHRTLALSHAPLTLASAPLEIAASWSELLKGQRLRRRFLVLKVQRHAAVELRMLQTDGRRVVVEVTPVAWPLRWLFGSTHYHFDRAALALDAIDGLLDPRDRRGNGRWREYLGRIEFATPVPLRQVHESAVRLGART